MGREWEVTTERLESSATVIEEKTARFNTEWEKLYTEVQNLRSAQWRGIASETFNSKLEGYRNDFQEMAQILISYVEFLRDAAKNYKNTEESLRDAAGNLYAGN